MTVEAQKETRGFQTEAETVTAFDDSLFVL